MNYCAPDREAQESYRRHKTCFTVSSLRKLASAWNQRVAEKPILGVAIQNIGKKGKEELWQELKAKMNGVCGGVSQVAMEGCWIDQLRIPEENEAYQDLRAPKPVEWYKNPHTWLSNFDIENVMLQYENDPENQYHFLGVFPMDFANLYEELNDLKWSHLTKKGTCKYIGMITNLDNHNQPGSHWCSFFAVLDPSLPSFGAYYYDSVSDKPTFEIKQFMVKLMVKTWMELLKHSLSPEDFARLNAFPFKNYTKTEIDAFTRMLGERLEKKMYPYPFKLNYNTHQHQYENTECGIFSIVFQTRWIEGLRADPKMTFDRVVSHRMKDNEIHTYRDVFFRPNTKVLVGASLGGTKRRRVSGSAKKTIKPLKQK
jgi:hypothetical protein